MPLNYGKIPRNYDFVVNGYGFKIIVSPWNDDNIHPRDILIKDLETCVEELKRAEVVKPFVLPPLKNDVDQSKKISKS